jgi:hypothetical protein
MSYLTKAQDKAIKDAKAILMKEFESVVIVLRATDENQCSHFPCDWHGHLSDVVGLLKIATVRVDKNVVDGMYVPE